MSNKDTIYRQDVIDIVTFECGKWKGLSKEITKQINALPPVQPEIIHCKECKHHWTHRCMDSPPIEICDLKQTFYDAEVDFCSLGKRREEIK